MRKFILIILFVAGKISFAQSFELNGSDTVNYTDANNLRQGFWIILNKVKKLPGYREDQKVEEGSFKDNKKFGLWKQFFPSGKLKSEITYANNRPSGYAKMFYENGQVMEEGKWENNRWIGTYKQYYENGKVFYDFNYNDQGKREGDQKYFHPNGNVMAEGNWQDGKENGVIREYYENGTLRSEKVFNGGTIDPSQTKEYSEKSAVTVSNSKKDENPKNSNTNTNTVTVEKTNENNTTAVKTNTNTSSNTVSGSAEGVGFLSDGYHKVYNNKKQVIKEGNFKDGKLLEGKEFEYKDNEVVAVKLYSGGKFVKRVEGKDVENYKK